jgi:hypothetical protein
MAGTGSGRQDPLLTVDQISDLIWETEGVRVSAASLTHYASAARRLERLDEHTQWDMPVPDPADELVTEREGPGMGPRRVVKPRWRASAILAWRSQGRKPAPGEGGRPGTPRPRTPAGQYLATVAAGSRAEYVDGRRAS